jgi:hypothetical protein
VCRGSALMATRTLAASGNGRHVGRPVSCASYTDANVRPHARWCRDGRQAPARGEACRSSRSLYDGLSAGSSI